MKKGQTSTPSLKVTYRRGKPYAAYLSLPTQGERRAEVSRPFDDGIVADLDATGRCIGLELLAPTSVTLSRVNEVLQGLGSDTISEVELQPLIATRSVA